MRRSSALPFVLALGCNEPYPLPPTPCDDYCFATQRADCPEDYPEACVSQCEDDGVLHRHPDCEKEWSARNACYLGADDEEFFCDADEGHSVPRGELCLDERRALLTCISPEAELCLTDCFRRSRECGDDPGDCDWACGGQDTCNGEARAYYDCALENDVDCTDPEEDMRSPEEIPCLEQIGIWFDCLGWE